MLDTAELVENAIFVEETQIACPMELHSVDDGHTSEISSPTLFVPIEHPIGMHREFSPLTLSKRCRRTLIE
jgi:hypothetical protein